MHEREGIISREEILRVIEENINHGGLLFTDLFVIEHYLPQLHKEIPVNGEQEMISAQIDTFSGKRSYELIDGIEGIRHGEKVKYELSYNNYYKLRGFSHRRLRGIFQITSDSDGRLQSRTSLTKAGSHYHISSKTHMSGQISENLGSASLSLGEVSNFGEAINNLFKHVMMHKGEISYDLPQSAWYGFRPPSDLALSALQTYVRGFRDAAGQYQRSDIQERAEKVLDYITS